MKHAIKHLGLPEAPVKAVAEFRQIARQMFLAHPMMNAADIAFHIGNQGMHPGKQSHGLGPRGGNQPFMAVREA